MFDVVRELVAVWRMCAFRRVVDKSCWKWKVSEKMLVSCHVCHDPWGFGAKGDAGGRGHASLKRVSWTFAWTRRGGATSWHRVVKREDTIT